MTSKYAPHNAWRLRPKESGHKDVKRSLSEFSAEIGVSLNSIKAMKGNDPLFPKVSLQSANVGYYIHRELLQWWKARKARES